MFNTRNRTPSKDIGRALYLYFLGLSTRNVAKALSFLHIVKRSHVSIWNWIQKHNPHKISAKRTKTSEFIVDETAIKAGSELIWLWVAIEPGNKGILALSISKKKKNVCCREVPVRSGLVKEHGNHPVSTDGGTWYPQACKFLKIRHHLHSSLEKSLIERTMQYIKDRTECFDDYFPCRKAGCSLYHIKHWLKLYAAGIYNKEVLNA